MSFIYKSIQIGFCLTYQGKVTVVHVFLPSFNLSKRAQVGRSFLSIRPYQGIIASPIASLPITSWQGSAEVDSTISYQLSEHALLSLFLSYPWYTSLQLETMQHYDRLMSRQLCYSGLVYRRKRSSI